MYTGVVENIDDPLKLGRVKARFFSIHSDKKENGIDFGIPTDDLPWAEVMTPTTSASVNGIGDSPTGIVNGTWVVAFFRGDEMQDPVIIGTINGVPQKEPEVKKGFNDPDGVYPKADFIGESDVNRLARNESIDKTIVQSKTETIKQNVARADGSSWSEPVTPYDAVYPHNKVNESKSGHIHEVDDTEGKERLHTYHRAGTFTEVHPDGTQVIKIVGKGYTIILDGNDIFVEGDSSETASGKKNIQADILNINISTSANITIPTTEWKGNINIEGDVKVTGNIESTMQVKGKTVIGIDDVTGGDISLKEHVHPENNTPPTP
ncbi:baseplate hub subunit and tail lysozyme [Paraglaciecola Antarctic GD virus 1]|nr:baseplate hub subunit and tail lysozyme [Paraglaciecola Antarctic GD virus 1]